MRVTVGVSDRPDGQPVEGVSGALIVRVDGTEITPPGGIAPVNAPFAAGPGADPSDENGTLNFEILAPTGIGASDDVDIRVDLAVPAGETDDTNNSGTRDDLSFVATAVPAIFHTRVFYAPAGLALFPQELIADDVGPDFIRGTYPVNDAATELYRDSETPSLIYSYSCNGDDQIDIGCSGFGNTQPQRFQKTFAH